MATEKVKKKIESDPLIDNEHHDLKVRFHTICIDGDKYRTLYTEKYRTRVQYQTPDPKKIYSEIPGTIIKLHVTEGQKIEKGDLMLVLEAMKMKNKLLFPISGVVKKIHVLENERIPKKHLMVELE